MNQAADQTLTWDKKVHSGRERQRDWKWETYVHRDCSSRLCPEEMGYHRKSTLLIPYEPLSLSHIGLPSIQLSPNPLPSSLAIQVE